MGTDKLFLFFALGFLGLTATIAQSQRELFRFSPCLETRCHTYARCEVNNASQALCVCPKNCSSSRKPVCGTNWRTYNNMCELMAKSCANNDLTRLRYNGECGAGDCRRSRWQYLRCPYYSQCNLHYGLPRCLCPKLTCPSAYHPVCGTNGITYRNLCLLRNVACKTKTWLYDQHLGHCRPDPCRFINCCCGAVCRVNQTSQQKCECAFGCTQELRPVCGSDGKTYGNPCTLRLASCEQQNPKLVQVSSGPCSTGPTSKTITPCSILKCAHYAECKVVLGNPRCMCPTACPSSNIPVCGSDYRTYDNECHLKRTSCNSQTNITVARNGTCDAVVPKPTVPVISLCAVVRCGYYATCKEIKGAATCVCPSLCPNVSAPVCGSDAKTYDNECALKWTSCHNKTSITVAKTGPCEPAPTVSPCGVRCGYHATCEVVNGVAKCVCPSLCPNITSPVCGSDGNTYENECGLRRTSCRNQTSIGVVKKGACGPSKQPLTENPCSRGRCAHYASCHVVKGAAMCVCPVLCPGVTPQVCGSDGQTYENNCAMRRVSCKTEKTISVAGSGPCLPPTTQAPTVNPCALGICGYYATCQVIAGSATCVCPKTCPTVRAPVCGSDRRTYDNECALKNESCMNRRRITIVKREACVPPQITTQTPTVDPCSQGRCAHYARCQVVAGQAKCICPELCPGLIGLVCGSDAKTYENECSLRRTSCTQEIEISVAKKGACVPPPITTETPTVRPCRQGTCAHYARCQMVAGQAKCICPHLCPGLIAPVCGSDGRTYDNECTLRRTSCKSQTSISAIGFGVCAKPTTPQTNVKRCTLGRCAHYAMCQVVNGVSTCVCPSRCPGVTAKVCASDGRTYENECELRWTSCNSQRTITVAARRACAQPTTKPTTKPPTQAPTQAPTDNPCLGGRCAHYALCQVVTGAAMCVCPELCPSVTPQVCGSDGQTYENNCAMRRTSCKTEKTITIAGSGPCYQPTAPAPTINPCAGATCGYHGTCEVVNGRASCVCPKTCPRTTDPVCGSDGTTYQNWCDLKRASCRDKRMITVLKKGFCGSLARCPIPKACLQICNQNECGQGQMCCCQGCGHVCTAALWHEGRYVCPPDPLGCRNDNDCTGGKMCCPTGCNRRCIAPAL